MESFAVRKAILIMLLTLVSSGAAAEWVEVYPYEKGFTNYADPATIVRSGDKVKMWSMGNRKTPSDKYMSFKYLIEYDCATAQYRWLDTSFHSEKMGVGTASYRTAARRYWKPIRSGSGTIFETLWIFACGKP